MLRFTPDSAAGSDPAPGEAILAAMERDLAELDTWRRRLLVQLDAESP
jgi:hypothetical protein